MRALTASERQVVALALLALALMLAWALIVAPVRQGFRDRALQRESLLLTYARNERVIAMTRGYRLALREQRRTAGVYAIAAPGETEAAAALRERVLSLARAAGVGSASASETAAEDGWVAVRADLQLTLGQLETLLRALQNGRPPAIIRTLNISAERAAAAGQSDLIDARLEAAAPYALASAA